MILPLRVGDCLADPRLLPDPRAYPLVIRIGRLCRRMLRLRLSDRFPDTPLLPIPGVHHGLVIWRIPQDVRDRSAHEGYEVHD